MLTYILVTNKEETYIDKVSHNQYRFDGEYFTINKTELKKLIKACDSCYIASETMRYIK